MVPAVQVVAGKPGAVAEVLPPPPAVAARPAGPSQPGNAHPVPGSESPDSLAHLRHRAHDLVPQDQRELGLGEVAIHHVEVGAAHGAGAHRQEHLAGAGAGSVDRRLAQGSPYAVEQHRAHFTPLA
jgi:hypothetical protein